MALPGSPNSSTTAATFISSLAMASSRKSARLVRQRIPWKTPSVVLGPQPMTAGRLSARPTGMFGGTSAPQPVRKPAYHVADYEGDMICVVRDGLPNAGELIRMDLICPPTPELHRTAQSFEQLLFGFGSLREQHVEERFGPEAIDEVLSPIRAELGLDEEQMEDWTWFAVVALGEDEPDDQDVDDVPPAPNSHIHHISTAPLDDSDFDADVVSEHQRPVPEGFDTFAAIPTWPNWERDTFVNRFDGSVRRAFYSRLDGRVYQMAQWPQPNLDLSYVGYEGKSAHVRLCVIRGTPKPWNPDWVLDDVAKYPLVGFEPWEEAHKEIAALRRKLPELLAELPEKQKAKILQNQQQPKS
jgi:hypothetical protein